MVHCVYSYRTADQSHSVPVPVVVRTSTAWNEKKLAYCLQRGTDCITVQWACVTCGNDLQ